MTGFERTKDGQYKAALQDNVRIDEEDAVVSWKSLSAYSDGPDGNRTETVDLGQIIEAGVIPRLLLAHRESEKGPRGRLILSDEPPSKAVEILAEMAVSSPLGTSKAYLEKLQAGGMSVEEILSDVLGPTARYLGTLWESDRRSYVDVTFGLSRLQQLLRIYGPNLELAWEPNGEGMRMLLSTMPGDQHSFGLSVVEEFFRCSGWDVQIEMPKLDVELMSVIRHDWFDVLGLSACADRPMAAIAALLPLIRSTSLNPNIRVMIGGRAIVANHDEAVGTGADIVAEDRHDALHHIRYVLHDMMHPHQTAGVKSRA